MSFYKRISDLHTFGRPLVDESTHEVHWDELREYTTEDSYIVIESKPEHSEYNLPNSEVKHLAPSELQSSIIHELYSKFNTEFWFNNDNHQALDYNNANFSTSMDSGDVPSILSEYYARALWFEAIISKNSGHVPVDSNDDRSIAENQTKRINANKFLHSTFDRVTASIITCNYFGIKGRLQTDEAYSNAIKSNNAGITSTISEAMDANKLNITSITSNAISSNYSSFSNITGENIYFQVGSFTNNFYSTDLTAKYGKFEYGINITSDISSPAAYFHDTRVNNITAEISTQCPNIFVDNSNVSELFKVDTGFTNITNYHVGSLVRFGTNELNSTDESGNNWEVTLKNANTLANGVIGEKENMPNSYGMYKVGLLTNYEKYDDNTYLPVVIYGKTFVLVHAATVDEQIHRGDKIVRDPNPPAGHYGVAKKDPGTCHDDITDIDYTIKPIGIALEDWDEAWPIDLVDRSLRLVRCFVHFNFDDETNNISR